MSDPRRGELWQVNLDPTVGDEIGKARPCVVLSGSTSGKLNLRIVAPVTEWKDRYRHYFWMTRLEPEESTGLTKLSAADSFQVRSVSVGRFVKCIGVVADDRLDRIIRAAGLCMR
jgi:mRNA interferase MazF